MGKRQGARTMENKTALERDIERIELFKTPLGVKVVIVLLIAGLAALGLYAIDLKQKVTVREKEIAEIRKVYQEEKIGLMEEIRKLTKKAEPAGPE
jgi:membrane protein insertase Oxa1/YidC/SpoIIIJ